MNNANIISELTCPLTLDFFEDPVTVPCCGKAFTRDALITHMNSSVNMDQCPLCNGDISNFDVHSAPKNVIIAGLVDEVQRMSNTSSASNNIQFVQQTQLQQNVQNQVPPQWSAEIMQLVNEDDVELPIGELKISLQNTGTWYTPKPCLFIVVVDKSGSMSGQPWRQVQSALVHIMNRTHGNVHVKTVLIAYDSGASIIDTNGPIHDVESRILRMSAGGGTNFSSAFDKVKEVLTRHQCNQNSTTSVQGNNFSNAVVTFLTDGDDYSGFAIDTLPGKFKEIIRTSWTGPISIHSIGFGRSHNLKFLEELRKIGTNEGVYRYAEPEDEGDSLCGKLTSIFDAVSASSTIAADIKMDDEYPFYEGVTVSNNETKQIQIPINDDGKGSITRWVRINNKYNLDEVNEKTTLLLNSELGNNNETINVEIKQCPIGLRKELLNRWIVTLIDNMAAEALELSSKNRNDYGKNVFELHCALILQRAQYITNYISNEFTQNRLNKIVHEVEAMKNGSTVSVGKLNDLRFDSQFSSTQNTKQVNTVNNNTYVPTTKPVVAPTATIMQRITFARGTDRGWNRIHDAVIYNYLNIISSATNSELIEKDRDGNTPLALAAYTGRIDALKYIINKNIGIDYINMQNNSGHTALDLAINSGFWISTGLLIDAGALVSSGLGNDLLLYCLNRGYYETSSVIISAGIADVTDDMKNNIPSDALRWVLNKGINIVVSPKNIQSNMDLAVSKGMPDLVREMINNGATLNNKMLYDACVQNSAKHLEVCEILLDNGVDVNGGVPEEGGADTPLFIVSQKGALDYVRLFIKRGADVNRKNDKGNPPLWMACCNKHTEVVAELLNSGADPNCVNEGGNNPLIPCCQKGLKDIAMMLIIRGVDVEYVNKNGDTPIIICCRTGQVEVLELLLSRAGPNALNHYAHIDGFTALLSATEANKADCIKVLFEHEVDLEQRTTNDNPIIANSTSLHLAAYYGKFEAAKQLLVLGANPNCKDSNDSTPMHIAVKQGFNKIVQLLKTYKADVFARDHNGYTPAFYCRDGNDVGLIDPIYSLLIKLARGEFPQQEEIEACKVLRLYCGAVGCLSTSNAVDVTDSDLRTPLMESIIYSNTNVTKTLLELGANPELCDIQGLNSFVWSEWINNNRIKQLLPSIPQSTANALTNLRNASMKDVNNAMVLFMPVSPPKDKCIALSVSGITEKMNNFTNIITTNIKYLDINTNKLSLVKFCDKIANNNIFVEGPSAMKTLLWNAKTFIVGKIASNNVENTLSPQEMLAIYIYTTNTGLSKLVNSTIIDYVSGVLVQNEQVLQYARFLNDALLKIEPHNGVVYRGVNVPVDRKLYMKGSEIVWPTFNTASLDWNNVCDFNDKKIVDKVTMFIIRTKTGIPIRKYSAFPRDAEVMLLPGKKYVVKNWFRLDIICMAQENIRTTTFKITDDTIDKYLNDSCGLVIELDEL
jgi:ankyrin repeat protein/uncharacterized protein YegL